MDQKTLKLIITVSVLPLPALAVGTYWLIDFFSPLGFYVSGAIANTFYAASVAAAASLFEFNFVRRAARIAVVAVVGYSLYGLLDFIMILGVAAATGFVAVGTTSGTKAIGRRHSLRVAVNVLHRLVRSGVACGTALGLIMVPLPRSGQCPFGGGDITEAFGTFTFITYGFIAVLLVFDHMVRGTNRG
ncbi:MAG: hypothetical protein A2V70_00435 [Planctomycetes bacterium RBG_13_63_9]|nr:MAG: hypothetical protein A2V70_00435 [Planctomycetes bacterium RBG_13_63_9]